MANNPFVAGQKVTIFVADHHTFKAGEEATVHKDHLPENDFVMLCDPKSPSEFWVLELGDMVPPSPSAAQRMEDENYVEVIVKVGKKRLVVTNKNRNEVTQQLIQDWMNACAAIRLINSSF